MKRNRKDCVMKKIIIIGVSGQDFVVKKVSQITRAVSLLFERVGCVDENAALLWVVNYSPGTQLPESGVRRRKFRSLLRDSWVIFCGKQGRERPYVAPLPPQSRRSALGKITVSQLDKKKKGP